MKPADSSAAPKRGRPLGSKGGLVRVRCELEEKGRWTAAARDAGKTLSEWLRGRANGDR